MSELSFVEKIRKWLGSIAWKTFLWANEITDVQYWASLGFDTLSDMVCACEDAGNGEARWNKNCPHHGEYMQKLEREYTE